VGEGVCHKGRENLTKMKGRDGVRNEDDIWCVRVLASTLAFLALRLKDVRRDVRYVGTKSRRQTHLQHVNATVVEASSYTLFPKPKSTK
jgi:hypothetical protein